MGNIYDSSTFKEIANVLGLSDKQFQDQLSVTAGTAASYLQLGRQFVYDTFPDSASNSVLDAATLLGQTYRLKENSLSSTINPVFGQVMDGINTYFNTTKSKTMRNYFDSKTADTTIDFVSSGTAYTTGLSFFRAFYSRYKNEELIYKLYSLTGVASTSGTATSYGHSSNFTSSLIELRLGDAVSGSACTFVITATRPSGTTDTITTTVGAGISITSINGSITYSSVSSIQVPANFTTSTPNLNPIEIWTR
jgi:hypothetical protein